MSTSQLHECSHFLGLQLHTPARLLAPGELTLADNLRVDGGDLVSRPGIIGQLAAPFATPLFAPYAYLTATGTDVVFVSNGRVYHWTKGTSTATEITVPTLSGSLVSARVRWARQGHYLYGTDGTNPPFRLDMTSGAVVPGLSAPTTAIVAALTNSILKQVYLASGWSSDGSTGSSTNLLPGYGNAAGAFSVAGWTRSADADIDLAYGHSLNLDGTGEQAQTALIANPGFTGNTALHAKKFSFAMDLHYDDAGANPNTGSVKVEVFDAGSVSLSSQTVTFSRTSPQGPQALTSVFDFTAVASEIAFVQVTVKCVSGPNGPDHQWVNNAQLFPLAAVIGFADGTSGAGVAVTATEANAAGSVRNLTGVSLIVDLGAATDVSQIDSLVFALANADKWAGLGYHTALQQDGSVAWIAANDMTIAANNASMFVDISTVAVGARTNIRKIKLTFTADVTLSDTTSAGALKIGPLLAGGNLSVVGSLTAPAAPVYWVYTEVNDNGDALLANIIESNGGPFSNHLSPAADQATAALTLPAAPLNASATMFYLYRFGGVYGDGLGRLVTKRKWGDVVAYGADTGQPGSAGNLPNPYISWNAGAFVDNTPDLWLFGATTMVSGRDAPPTGAQAIAAWQGRVWLAVGGTLYGSWLVNQNQQAGLYFNRTNSASDPLNSVKGWSATIGQDDADPILALIPIGSNVYSSANYLVVIKQHTVAIVSGTDPGSFRIQEYLRGKGVGGIAPSAACLVGDKTWFLAPTSVQIFDGNTPERADAAIQPYIKPLSGTAQSAAALAGAVMIAHDLRTHLFGPRPGDASNTVCLVFDSRTGYWTRELMPFSMSVNGAASLSSGTDTADLVIAGSDGQIYLQTAGTYVDKHLPGDAGTAIAWAVKGRGCGMEGGGLSAWQRNLALRAYAQVLLQETVAATVTVDTEAQTQLSQVYSLASFSAPEIAMPPASYGAYHVPGIAGSSSTLSRIGMLGVESVETAPQK